MENAKIGLFEDHDRLRENIARELVDTYRHQVPVLAASAAEALAVIKGLEPGSLDVALVDGNLTRGRKDNAEGARIAKALREVLGDGVSIIGMSLTEEPIAGADIDIPKSNMGAIAAHIDSL